MTLIRISNMHNEKVPNYLIIRAINVKIKIRVLLDKVTLI